MSKNEIAALFDEWNNALQTGDPKKVAALYESDGILLPTVSNKVRHNHAEIEDYFVHFLAKGPVGKIDEANIRIFNNRSIVNSFRKIGACMAYPCTSITDFMSTVVTLVS